MGKIIGHVVFLLCVCELAHAQEEVQPKPYPEEQEQEAQVREGYSTDSKGRTFRVEFEPGSEVRLGVTSGVGGSASGWSNLTALSLGLSYRLISISGKDNDQIRWQLDNRFVTGRISPWSRGSENVPAIDMFLFEGSYLRHSAEPYMTLPTSPPRRLFFPFDIGLEAQVGRLRTSSAADEHIRLGVARAAVLFDPWRSGRSGNSLEIGLGIRYDMELVGDSGFSDPLVVHLLAPFTALGVRLRVQDDSGLTSLDFRTDLVPMWSSEEHWVLTAESQIEFRRTLIALNDEPISLVLKAGWERCPPVGGLDRTHELKVLAGLEIGFQLH